jgi:uncharacterized cupredoxin-like copper-binding protein
MTLTTQIPHSPRAGGVFAILLVAAFFAFSGPAMASPGGHDDKAAEKFSFGYPSPAAEPDQEVRITALDTMRFDPPAIKVKAGSTVKFVVTNKGEVVHAWSLGTPREQEEHEEGMEDVPMSKMMTHMNGEANGFVLKPGETKTLVWTFARDGEIQYACHIPGHYASGMYGSITIAAAAGQKMSHGHKKHAKTTVTEGSFIKR